MTVLILPDSSDGKGYTSPRASASDDIFHVPQRTQLPLSPPTRYALRRLLSPSQFKQRLDLPQGTRLTVGGLDRDDDDKSTAGTVFSSALSDMG